MESGEGQVAGAARYPAPVRIFRSNRRGGCCHGPRSAAPADRQVTVTGRIAGPIPSLDVGTGVRPGGWFVRPRTGTAKSAQRRKDLAITQVKLLPPRGAQSRYMSRHRTRRPRHSCLQCRFLANRNAQMPLTQSAKGNTPWSFLIRNRTADSLVEPGILRSVKCLPRWPGASS